MRPTRQSLLHTSDMVLALTITFSVVIPMLRQIYCRVPLTSLPPHNPSTTLEQKGLQQSGWQLGRQLLNFKTVTISDVLLLHDHDLPKSSKWGTRWRTGVEARVKVSSKVERDGHGRATVVGFQGDNLIISHRNNFLRCAPEQVRHATLAETTGDTLVENILRGAQTVLQQTGQQGMVDLTQAEKPPTLESVNDAVKKNTLGRIKPVPSCIYTVVNRARHGTNTSHDRQRCDRC